MWKIPISIIKTQIVIMISISFFHICIIFLSLGEAFERTDRFSDIVNKLNVV